MADYGNIEVEGLVEQQAALEALLMKNPAMEKRVQKIIKKVLMEARRNIMSAAKEPSVMKSDPRQAYKAVRTTVYRQILGGNVNILRKSKRGAQFSNYEPPRTLQPKQRGGNRRKRDGRTDDLMKYAGSDRGFILRFLNAGTDKRNIKNFARNPNRESWPSVKKWSKHPNTGNRGSIAPRNFFATSSQKAMETAANNLLQYINELIEEELK